MPCPTPSPASPRSPWRSATGSWPSTSIPSSSTRKGKACSPSTRWSRSSRRRGKEGDMPDSLVLLETDHRVATITLNRPEKLNALNGGLYGELDAALERADADEDVR